VNGPATVFRPDPSQTGRMRILFVTNLWPDEERPHYGSFVASQAQSLRDRGLTVDVLHLRGHASTLNYLTGIPGCTRRVLDRSYDVVHIHFGHTLVSSLAACLRPSVVSYCGSDLLGQPAEGGGLTRKSRIEVAVFRQMSRLFGTTITKSLEMEKRLPASRQRLNTVLPNGVDVSMFKPADKQKARADLGWPADGKAALFLGNPDDPRKNLATAQKAVDRLAANGVPIKLQIGWKLPSSEIPKYMNAADVLLFPSLSEGSPNVVKEALACALPVVATRVGDLPERLVDLKGCVLSGPTVEEFEEGITTLLGYEDDGSLRSAAEDVSLDAIAERLELVYGRAIG